VTELAPVKPRAMRDTLLQSIYELMLQDSEIFFVSADFGSPVIDKIRADKPDRFINVGIAEQNLINVSAGLALEGFKVFAYAIAPFITMRCFEQIRVSLALMSKVRPMNVNLIGVGAGYSYVVSGPTHQCYEDITLMRSMPNMRVLSLSDQHLASMMPAYCMRDLGVKYLRLDAQVLPMIYQDIQVDLNEGFYAHKKGVRFCLVATGFMVHTAIKVAEALSELNIEVGIIDLFNLTTFDAQKFNEALTGYKTIVSMEEAFSGRGGLDALMFNYIAHQNLNINLINIGVEGDYRFEIGSRQHIHEEVGIGVKAIIKKILSKN
jgi:transketolase